MTDTTPPASNPPPPVPPVSAPSARAGGAPSGRGARRGSVPLLWCVVVLLAVTAGVAGYAFERKVERFEQQLTQRQRAGDVQATQLQTKADQALAAVQQTDAHIAQLEGKLADTQTAQQALTQQYADLARNRDDWTLAEVGQMLSTASEQLELTGNTQLALFALQSADTRLAASSSPQALAVRKAVAQDMDKLKSAPSTDLAGLAIKLDTVYAQVDSLPLAGEAPIARPVPKAAKPASAASAAAAQHVPQWKAWLDGVAAGVGQQIASLVQVRRIDNADAMLVSPDQGYFVRENLKLRLLSARLSLLSRNATTLKADLDAADAALAHYFDNGSKATAAARDLVKQVQAGTPAVALPNLNTSLQAIQQYRSRG